MTTEAEDEACWLAFTDNETQDSPLNLNNKPAHPFNDHHNTALILDGQCSHKQYPILYDSGASCHMLSDYKSFINHCPVDHHRIIIANNKTINTVDIGDMVLSIPAGILEPKIRLTDVLYSPQLGYTLIFMAKIDDTGYSTTFVDGCCQI